MAKKHKKEHHEEHVDESWLIPYADILTLLLALFIILFASSKIDQKKYDQIMKGFNTAFTGGTFIFEQSSVAEMDKPNNDMTEQDKQDLLQELIDKETADLMNIKTQIDSYIDQNGLSSQIVTELNEDMLMIMIRDNALFESGSANVKVESQKLAVKIAEMLVAYPNYTIEVAGHTDNVPVTGGKFESNWDLSTQRAINFMKHLMQNGQLNQARFKAIGYGEYKPVVPNDSDANRSKNRRVEVDIIRNVKSTASLKAPSNLTPPVDIKPSLPTN